MSVVPFRWQGKTRSEQIRALVHSRGREWMRNWCAGPSDFELAVLVMDRPDSGRNSDRWYQLNTSAGALTMRVPSSAFGQLGARLAGVIASDSAGFAAGIGERALCGLGQVVANAGSAEPLGRLAARPSPEALEARCGAVALLWSMESLHIELFLDARLCDALLPVRTVTSQSLAPRASAIGAAEVSLEAMLDLGAIALADAHLLKPGEVLKTRVPLDAQIAVRSSSGATVFTGVLAASDGQRALRFVRTEQPKVSP